MDKIIVFILSIGLILLVVYGDDIVNNFKKSEQSITVQSKKIDDMEYFSINSMKTISEEKYIVRDIFNPQHVSNEHISLDGVWDKRINEKIGTNLLSVNDAQKYFNQIHLSQNVKVQQKTMLSYTIYSELSPYWKRILAKEIY